MRRLRAQWAPMSALPSDLSPSVEPPPAAYTGLGARIGVFDSGLGGLSVLKALRERLPQADLLYVADSAHAPYGERDEEFIAQRSEALCQFLLRQGVHTIVVACNTATAAAIHLLRAQYPGLPIVGVEPGVKPAVALSVNKRVGVLATPGTLASNKFKRLIDAHGQQALIVAQACPGLAREIERGLLDTPRLRDLIDGFCAPLRQAGVDTAVLGCTHYPFVAPLFKEALGGRVMIVDTADAVARHTARACEARHGQLKASEPPRTRLWTSGDPALLSAIAHSWLQLNVQATTLG